MEIDTIAISDIERRADLQPRETLDPTVVDEYAEAMEAGDAFPPIEVIMSRDGESCWMWDGFHRVAAAEQIGQEQIRAHLVIGTLREAILKSVQANATHGLRRSNADKRKAVSTLLEDPEWSQWSDREIARRTHTSHPFVATVRKELGGNISTQRRFRDGHGGVSTMDVEPISEANKARAEKSDHDEEKNVEYAPIWLLNNAIRAYLNVEFGDLEGVAVGDRADNLGARLDRLLELNKSGDYGDIEKWIPQLCRKGDLEQALNNVIDELLQDRARLEEREPTIKYETVDVPVLTLPADGPITKATVEGVDPQAKVTYVSLGDDGDEEPWPEPEPEPEPARVEAVAPISISIILEPETEKFHIEVSERSMPSGSYRGKIGNLHDVLDVAIARVWPAAKALLTGEKPAEDEPENTDAQDEDAPTGPQTGDYVRWGAGAAQSGRLVNVSASGSLGYVRDNEDILRKFPMHMLTVVQTARMGA